MFSSTVTSAGQVKRLTVIPHGAGWEAREEHDSRVVRTVQYTDWHRVERAIESFRRQDAITTPGVVPEFYSTNR